MSKVQGTRSERDAKRQQRSSPLFGHKVMKSSQEAIESDSGRLSSGTVGWQEYIKTAHKDFMIKWELHKGKIVNTFTLSVAGTKKQTETKLIHRTVESGLNQETRISGQFHLFLMRSIRQSRGLASESVSLLVRGMVLLDALLIRSRRSSLASTSESQLVCNEFNP